MLHDYGELFIYGLKGGSLVRVEDVSNGFDCGCTCPQCGEPLIAYNKQDSKRAKHFQHKSRRNCEGYYETVIHYLAKEIISERGFLVVPDVFFNLSEHAKRYRADVDSFSSEGGYGARIEFDNVELEKWEGSFRPDIKASKNEKVCYIEIAVSHFVDETKLRKIANENTAVLEIDLSHCKSITTKEELEREIYFDARMKWLYNPKIEKRRDEAESAGKGISRFVESSIKVLKAYGRGGYIYKCPIHKENKRIKLEEECQRCNCFAGELQASYRFGDRPEYPERFIECIGHIQPEFRNLLISKGVQLEEDG